MIEIQQQNIMEKFQFFISTWSQYTLHIFSGCASAYFKNLYLGSSMKNLQQWPFD